VLTQQPKGQLQEHDRNTR